MPKILQCSKKLLLLDTHSKYGVITKL